MPKNTTKKEFDRRRTASAFDLRANNLLAEEDLFDEENTRYLIEKYSKYLAREREREKLDYYGY